MGRHTTLTAADGFELGAWRAEPAGAPRGGIVVIQEIFGVNAHIREVCDGFAEDGYLAIAPALFDRVEGGIELAYDEDGIARGADLARNRLDRERALQDLQAAVDEAATAGAVGVVGYCFGGLLAWLAACRLEGVAAAASYYGGGVSQFAELAPKCPVIFHFGARDAHIPMEQVEDIRTRHPELPVHVYDADHGFNCDHRASFDGAAAALARERTLAFFATHLVGRRLGGGP
ncbi:MAG TPA: dienelactone hydrolase family protein [Pseudomonadales bacterium]|nr:dienelactone hydrolase family protein [Pseudomonadales bacterium]